MATRSSAELASRTEIGFCGNPLKIKLISNSNLHDMPNPSPTTSFQSSQFISSQQNANFQDYESLVLRKMRQAEERKRLEQEILEQDELENLTTK